MIDLLTNTLALIFALGVIIFIHELGHLLVAKLFDTRVKTFSLGFGKRLWGFERGETDYRVSLIPLGGYVALGGEMPEDATGDPREFMSKPRWQRILVYLAGPAMNAVLSVAIITGLFMVGISVADFSEVDAVVGRVAEGSSAEAAGLEAADRIVAVDGQAVEDWDDLKNELMTSAEEPVELTVERDDRTFQATVTPGTIPRYEIGDTAGIAPRILPQVHQVLPDAPAAEAGFEAGDLIVSVDGRAVAGTQEFIDYVQQRPGEEVRVDVLRDEASYTLPVTPADVDGRGQVGLQLGHASLTKQYGLSLSKAFVASVRHNVYLVEQIGVLVGKLVTGELAAKSALGGPIEIAAQSGAAARLGFGYLLYFTAFISLNIGLLNLLPIPVLDGGQIVILVIESTIRRDLSLRLKELITQVGFVLIMLLMLAVIWFDLAKNLPEGWLPG